MEDGYHINVAKVSNKKAWNFTKDNLQYESRHYCSIYLGRHLEADAVEIAKDIRERFPQGDAPGQFKVTMTHWQSRGEGCWF